MTNFENRIDLSGKQELPRILILTRWPPDGRYASGEALRKLIGRLPMEKLRWAYMDSRRTPDCDFHLPEHKEFLPGKLHWRLQETFMGYFYTHHVRAGTLARRISEWVSDFRPQLLWVASDLEAIRVSLHLMRDLGVPLHATTHDAYDSCRFFGISKASYYLYEKTVRAFMRTCGSMDAVSQELLDHIIAEFGDGRPLASAVVRPSVDLRELAEPLPVDDVLDMVCKIGFCGASRGSDEQWRSFLSLLSRIDRTFHIIAFASKDFFHEEDCPSNVKVEFKDYVPSGLDIIRYFRENRVHACYLNLWKDKEKALFAETSLSSKLTTYAASGMPTIVDGPANSVAWKLISKYEAGVLCGDDDVASLSILNKLFGDIDYRNELAKGAWAMCKAEFDLDRNAGRLKTLLCQAVSPRDADSL